MKKKNLTTLTIVALLLVLVTLIGVSGTYAKYTTSVSGKAQAIVAKWDFGATVGGEATDNFTINLTEKSTNLTGVVEVDGVKKIQPGSSGTIQIVVDNTGSDVPATLTVTGEQASGLSDAQFDFVVPAGSEVIDAGATKTIDVTWVWNYSVDEATDTVDTTTGENATDAAVDLITLKVTGTQVEPTV